MIHCHFFFSSWCIFGVCPQYYVFMNYSILSVWNFSLFQLISLDACKLNFFVYCMVIYIWSIIYIIYYCIYYNIPNRIPCIWIETFLVVINYNKSKLSLGRNEKQKLIWFFLNCILKNKRILTDSQSSYHPQHLKL